MKSVIVLFLMVIVLIAGCTSDNQLTGNIVTGNDACKSLSDVAKDDCYFELRKCSQIQKGSVRDSCVAELGIAKLDPAICNLITADSAKGYCQFGIAKNTNDVESCKGITDRYWKDNCHYEYATSHDNGVFCAAINAVEQQQDCFYEVATKFNRPEFCEDLPEARADQCIFKIAQATKDIKLCDSMNYPLSQDSCRLKLASKILMDESLCDAIQFKDLRDICHERLSESKRSKN